jgi:GNAT superfamily N-acetyltransferase
MMMMMMRCECSNCHLSSTLPLKEEDKTIVVKLCSCKLNEGIDSREIAIEIIAYSRRKMVGFIHCTIDEIDEADVTANVTKAKIQLSFDSIYVSPVFRKGGVANRLMAALIRLRKGSSDANIPVNFTIAPFGGSWDPTDTPEKRMDSLQLKDFYSKWGL